MSSEAYSDQPPSSPQLPQTETLRSTSPPPVPCTTSNSQDERLVSPAYSHADAFFLTRSHTMSDNAIITRHYTRSSQLDLPQPPRFQYPYAILNGKSETIQAFLRTTVDKANNPQPIYWSVLDIGVSSIGRNQILVFQCNINSECYGRVERLLEADTEHALLEVRLLAWNSLQYRLKSPDAIFIALACVTRERLTPEYQEQAQLRTLDHNVSCHALAAIANVHSFLKHRDMARVPEDQTTLALMDAFIENPNMQHFFTGLGTNSAYVHSDRDRRFGINIPDAPPEIDFSSTMPPYLTHVPAVNARPPDDF